MTPQTGLLDGAIHTDWEGVDLDLRQFLARLRGLADVFRGWRTVWPGLDLLVGSGRRPARRAPRRARLPAVVRSHAGRGAAGCCSSPRPGWSLAPGFAMTHRPLESLLEKLCSGDAEAAERVFLAFEPYLRMVVQEAARTPVPKFDSIDVVQSVWADVLRGSARPAGVLPTKRISARFWSS